MGGFFHRHRLGEFEQAMASYASKIAGLAPTDPWLDAKVDEAINGCTDVTGTIGSTFRLPDEEKLGARQKLIEPTGRLTIQLGGLEKMLVQNGSNGHVAGEVLTVADIAVWRLVGWLSGGKLDGIPKEYVSDTFPEIAKLCKTVDADPKVQEWKAQHPNNYE
eukprot:gnl/TRDRNA2_/TRDRNA2_177181_c0_seq38.p1 gnl/TRDRNA2_/TRDRNA2_177181_c0~~gnl/TRDRNA2_/TRDRNA2_177181_c0_seq38.p1  ORF type:complete len:162 (+),score=24.66 gnl/TRDRNA2_/TRDRNA2_177181_c0_seq38:478-963(+)